MISHRFRKQFLISLLVLGTLFSLLLVNSVLGGTTLGLTLKTNPDLNEDLVLHFTFDAQYFNSSFMTREVLDSSPSQELGNFLNHATTTVPGVLGQALHLDGIDDVIDVTENYTTNFQDDFTIALWMRSASTTATFDRSLVSTYDGGGGNYIAVNYSHDGDDFDFRYEGGSPLEVNSTGFNDLEWHHIVVTREGTRRDVFIDGQNVAGDNGFPAGTYTLTSNDHLAVGATVANPEGFHGDIDDVRIYTRALATSSVQRLYELGATTKIGKTLTSNPELENGLIYHATFDATDVDLSQASAEIRDRSASAEHGDWINSDRNTVPGVIGQAIELDGDDDRITGVDIGFSSVHTAAFWIKDKTGAGAVFGRSSAGNNHIGFDLGSELRYRNNTSSFIDIGCNCDYSEWNHIVYVRDGTSVTFFVNGSFLGAGILSSGASIDFNQIGARSTTDFVGGILDDVRFYNRALSTSTIERLYELGATTKINKTLDTNPDLRRGLVGHWSFDGSNIDRASSTSELKDSSGNNYHADWQYHATTTGPGVVGQAISMTDTDDRVWFPTTDSPGGAFTDFTYSVWLNVKSIDNSQARVIANESAVAGGDSAGALLLTRSGFENSYIRLLVGQDTTDAVADSENAYNTWGGGVGFDGGWQHVIATYDDTTKLPRIFINGVETTYQAQTAGVGTIDDTTAGNFFLGDSIFRSRNYNGWMDDVRVYDRVLSEEEILRLYQLGQ